METVSLNQLAGRMLESARASTSQRQGHTLHGGRQHALRQTLIALAATEQMHEHDSPGEATLHVLEGRLRVVAGPDSVELGPGDFLVIPPARHSVEALEDSVALLTTAVLAHPD